MGAEEEQVMGMGLQVKGQFGEPCGAGVPWVSCVEEEGTHRASPVVLPTNPDQLQMWHFKVLLQQVFRSRRQVLS